MGASTESGPPSLPTPSNSQSPASTRTMLAPYTSQVYIPRDSDYLVVSAVGSQIPDVPQADYALAPPLTSSSTDELKCSVQSPGTPLSLPSRAASDAASSGRYLWLTSPAVLDGKFVGLFFGADWCPYCKTFLAPLLRFYNFLRPTGMFEVVYVPCDRNMREYQSFVKTMPWYALPLRNYGDLIRKYNVKSLPSLVLVTPDDAVLSGNAVDLVKEKAASEKFKQIFQRFNGPVSIGNRFKTLFG